MYKKQQISGSEFICNSLINEGIEVVFGLPGTQNLEFFHALHHSKLKIVVPTSELPASFMANGYYRSSRKIAALTTIPRPGFTFALSGVAEAFLDSVPFLYLCAKPENIKGKKFQHQAIEQKRMIKPIVRAIFEINKTTDVANIIHAAMSSATSDEPGPVYVEIDQSVFNDRINQSQIKLSEKSHAIQSVNDSLVNQAIHEILQAERNLFYLGQGVNHLSVKISYVIEKFNSPVLTTSSGRGILPDVHPLLFPFDMIARGGGKTMKDLILSSDYIIALGCRFSFNGSSAFGYDFPSGKLIHVDWSKAFLNANYLAKYAIHCDTEYFIDQLTRQLKNPELIIKQWPAEDLVSWRKKAIEEIKNHPSIEKYFKDSRGHHPATFFSFLRDCLPENAILVTDSGDHQLLARKYFTVKNPMSYIIPSDFQSMGYGIQSAIGAKLANPNSTVIALVGDGGFNITGSEILTAIREGIELKIIVFRDGYFGLIRNNQVNRFGHSYNAKLISPDYELLSKSLNINFIRLDDKHGKAFSEVLKSPGFAIIEVDIRDSLQFTVSKARKKTKLWLTKLLTH